MEHWCDTVRMYLRSHALCQRGTQSHEREYLGKPLSRASCARTHTCLQKHRQTFGFPHRPAVSHRCQHLIASLIQDKENRLCSKRYQFKDLVAASSALSTNVSTRPSNNMRSSSHKQQSKGPRDFAGRYVFPHDAEDIKAHRWFRGVP